MTWSPPSTLGGGGALTGYTVTMHGSGNSSQTVGPGSTSATFTGVYNGGCLPVATSFCASGISYNFTVTANNALGPGPSSSASSAVGSPSTVANPHYTFAGCSMFSGCQWAITFDLPSNSGGSSLSYVCFRGNSRSCYPASASQPVFAVGFTTSGCNAESCASPPLSYTENQFGAVSAD